MKRQRRVFEDPVGSENPVALQLAPLRGVGGRFGGAGGDPPGLDHDLDVMGLWDRNRPSENQE
jgi:hypothetical protein